MEEKKAIKVRLGTTICIFIIIILTIALIAMWFFTKGIVSNSSTKDDNTSKLIGMPSTNYKVTLESYSEKGKELFSKFLGNQNDIVSYTINNCELKYYYDNEFICFVDYDIQVQGVAKSSVWMAGNGTADGNWIKNKNVYLSFIKQNDEYIYNERTGQMTAWSIPYNSGNTSETIKLDNDIMSISTNATKELIKKLEENLIKSIGQKTGIEIDEYIITSIDIKYVSDNEIGFSTTFDIKPKTINNLSDMWCTGNGELKGKWIVSKVQEVILEKQDDQFVIKKSGTGGCFSDLKQNNWID